MSHNAIRVRIFAGFVAHILFMITRVPTIIKQGHSIVPNILGIIALAKQGNILLILGILNIFTIQNEYLSEEKEK